MFIYHALADPLVMALLGLAVALLLLFVGWRRLGLLALVGSGLFLYLVSTPLVSQRLLSALEPDNALNQAEGGVRAQAIVVLSANLRRFAPEFGGETAGDLTLERMRYGAHLQRSTGLPVLVTGGRLGRSRQAIGRVMAEAYAADYGIGVRWVEAAAGNTYENAAYSRDILEREGVDTIHLVTHAWHMPRAVAAFEHVGFNVIPAPTGFTKVGKGLTVYDLVPRSRALTASAYAFHEIIGRLWYNWRVL